MSNVVYKKGDAIGLDRKSNLDVFQKAGRHKRARTTPCGSLLKLRIISMSLRALTEFDDVCFYHGGYTRANTASISPCVLRSLPLC